MSNNLSQYTHEKLYYAHCTCSSMYICPNSLYIYIYIYRVVVQGVCHVPLICRRSHVAGVSPFDSSPPVWLVVMHTYLYYFLLSANWSQNTLTYLVYLLDESSRRRCQRLRAWMTTVAKKVNNFRRARRALMSWRHPVYGCGDAAVPWRRENVLRVDLSAGRRPRPTLANAGPPSHRGVSVAAALERDVRRRRCMGTRSGGWRSRTDRRARQDLTTARCTVEVRDCVARPLHHRADVSTRTPQSSTS